MAKKTIASKLEFLPVLCQMCGKIFKTKQPTRAKFCSDACSCRWRRIHIRYRAWLALNSDNEKIPAQNP
jgi:hypothetical protein